MNEKMRELYHCSLASGLVVLVRGKHYHGRIHPSAIACGNPGSSAAEKQHQQQASANKLSILTTNTNKHNGTYSCAVVVLQETQVDLAMQVDGRKVGEGEHPEGESGHSGDAVLNDLHCTISLIRTP